MQPVDVYADKSSMAALHICPEKQKNATEQMWLYTYTHTRTQRGDLPFFTAWKVARISGKRFTRLKHTQNQLRAATHAHM